MSSIPFVTSARTRWRTRKACAQQSAQGAKGELRLLIAAGLLAVVHKQGNFGAPAFYVGNEMFRGDDRLDDAMVFAAKLCGAGI